MDRGWIQIALRGESQGPPYTIPFPIPFPNSRTVGNGIVYGGSDSTESQSREGDRRVGCGLLAIRRLFCNSLLATNDKP